MNRAEWDSPAGQARRIVAVFRRLASEAHRSIIESTANVTAEQFDAVIAEARKIGAQQDPPLCICPVYERAGWWTGDATKRLAALAGIAALDRNAGESSNNATAYRKFVDLAGWWARDAANLEEREALFRVTHNQPLDVSPTADYVLTRIDAAVEHDDLYVALYREQAA